MLATKVNQTYFAWSQGESTERDGSQGVSVSQKLDHGSISFGRFELESLSWEKWSIFTNDRRHEEFGKFNGLVAEKKAYFEEYYKRIRELKALQQQNQQTELPLEYSGDGHGSDYSQTAEGKPSAELETPSGSGTGVVDYVEQAAHETTSEQGLQCHDDHEDENFNAEFSSSNLSSSARVLQQTDQDIRENVCGDNSDSANRMDIVQQNVSSGHDGLGAAYEAVRAPKRIIEKDSRLRYASKIISKTVKTLSASPLDRISVSKRPVSVKASMSMNQKTKPNNTRSFQRPNAAPQKMAGTEGRNKLTAKETLGLTSVRIASSASAQRPSTRERHHISRESVKKPTTDVSTPRRPSTADRRPITRERAQKQADVTTPRRPSTSERRPVNRESAAKHADITTIRRPSTGERRPITRDSVLKMDPGTLSKSRATVAHPKGATTTASMLKMAVTPNASKSSKLETKSNIEGPKGPSTFNSHTTRSKRMDLQVAGKQKSSSVNLPPRKRFSCSVGEPALETFARLKKKDGIQTTTQSRAAASKKTAPSETGKVKARAPNPPPPPPRRASRTTNRPNASNSSIGGRKPKASAPKWH